ncbi:hypothetical protein FXW78_21070 [Rhodococcus opacus]|nr:hypothetical protein [Rhodococcus opacus]
MPGPKKYDAETQERAVRMYRDRIDERGGSKVAARRHVGELLDIASAPLRNWSEREETRQAPDASSSSSAPDVSAEVAQLRRRRRIAQSQRDIEDRERLCG